MTENLHYAPYEAGSNPCSPTSRPEPLVDVTNECGSPTRASPIKQHQRSNKKTLPLPSRSRIPVRKLPTSPPCLTRSSSLQESFNDATTVQAQPPSRRQSSVAGADSSDRSHAEGILPPTRSQSSECSIEPVVVTPLRRKPVPAVFDDDSGLSSTSKPSPSPEVSHNDRVDEQESLSSNRTSPIMFDLQTSPSLSNSGWFLHEIARQYL